MNEEGLTFVRNGRGYSIYTDAAGEEVYLQFTTKKRLYTAQWVLANHNGLLHIDFPWTKNTEAKRATWADVVIDPENLTYCDNCGQARLTATFDEGWDICAVCVSNMPVCTRCQERCGQVNSTADGNQACDACLDSYYIWCDECENYYDTTAEHYHPDADCDCEAPQQNFTIRNDGCPPLANDRRVRIALPSGTISDEGLSLIASQVQQAGPQPRLGWDFTTTDRNERLKWYQLAAEVTDGSLEGVWQTSEGNFTKRLSRLAYKTYGLKVSPDLMSEIGNIASAHSRAVDFDVEVTRNLNLPRGQFCNEGSCWWTDYAYSRCVLKSNGGLALRTFDFTGRVTGRVWVLPLRHHGNTSVLTRSLGLKQTFDTMGCHALVAFNGYESLEGFTGARVLAQMSGWTYRKIGFSLGEAYVNGDSAYLIAPEEIAAKFTPGTHLGLTADNHASLHTEEQSHDEVA